MATAKRNRTLLNVIMVVLAVVIVAAGVAFVVLVQGGQGAKPSFTVNAITGNANIERAGINYALEKGTALQENDVVETLNGSEVAMTGNGNASLYVADASRIRVGKSGGEKANASVELQSGCMFADAGSANAPLEFEAAGDSWTTNDAVFVFDARPGTVTVQVLAGEVKSPSGVAIREGEAYTAFTNQESGATSGEASQSEASRSSFGDKAGSSEGATKLSIASLDSFALDHALETVKSGHALAFTEDDINAELNRREAERLQVAEQADEPDGVGEVGEVGETQDAAPEEGGTEQADSPDATVDNSALVEGGGTGEAPAANAQESQGNGGTAEAPQEKPAAQGDKTYKCTLQIRCDTILKNMDKLAKGKSKYVPKNGVLLKSTSVKFKEGETAFDVLQRACKDNGIKLEYSYVPVYGSYYVEGIGNLYEFDCGDESGWMYKVNGWFPNYGCSQYQLSDGDTVVFCYTCKGLGDDVGA